MQIMWNLQNDVLKLTKLFEVSQNSIQNEDFCGENTWNGGFS